MVIARRTINPVTQKRRRGYLVVGIKPEGSIIYGTEVGPAIEEYNELAKALEESEQSFIFVIQPGKFGIPRISHIDFFPFTGHRSSSLQQPLSISSPLSAHPFFSFSYDSSFSHLCVLPVEWVFVYNLYVDDVSGLKVIS